MRTLCIAGRKSPLAMAQSRRIGELLRHAGIKSSISGMSTTGDRLSDANRPVQNSKDAFVGEIRSALLDGDCDLAVHSLKDLPTEPVPGLVLLAVCDRRHPGDVLIARDPVSSMDALPPGAGVGSVSLRRKCLLGRQRKDLRPVDIRGNIGTRLKKLKAGECDALILARAALERLGLCDRIAFDLPIDCWLPAPGQGALAVECRKDDPDLQQLKAVLDQTEDRLCTLAERAFSRALGAECRAPVAALAECSDNRLQLRGLVGSSDGRTILEGRVVATGPTEELCGELGIQLAEQLVSEGADRLLQCEP